MGSTDITAVVSTRGGVARASQVWQDGGYDRTSDVLAPYLSTTEGGESICQVGKLFEMPAKTLDGEARLLERGEDPTRESSGEGGDGRKNGRAEEQRFSICPKTASATSPGSHPRTDERSVEKRSTEQAPVRSWIRITSPHGNSEQQHQRSPRGGAQGTGTTSRVLATHVGAAVRQLGCVFQDMEPPKSILQKSSDMQKPIQRVKFTKAFARDTEIRDQNPSFGYICPGEPHQRSPNAPKFEDRSQEETEWQEQGACGAKWKLAKTVVKLKEKTKQHASHLLKMGACLHQLLNLRNENFLSTPERRCI